jgi:hypothetical protein
MAKVVNAPPSRNALRPRLEDAGGVGLTSRPGCPPRRHAGRLEARGQEVKHEPVDRRRPAAYAVDGKSERSALEPKGDRMFFELRQYHVRPGQQEKWVKCMEEEIIPFQVKMGMVILGSFVGEEDASVYVWIRRFESEAERKRLYDAVYQSDYWKNEISPRVPTLIDREQIKVTRIVATPRSVIQ